MQVARRREAQLAASVERLGDGEILTGTEADRTSNRWLQRTLSQVGEHLAQVRERVFTLAQLQRHHIVLDLNAGSGLLTWEAVRRVREGGVYACVRTQVEVEALQQQAEVLSELMRPVILQANLTQLPQVLVEQTPGVRFDRIVGRNALVREVDKEAAARTLAQLMSDSSILVLAESVPRHSQQLYQLLDPSWLSQELYERLVKAEESIYQSASNAMFNWDVKDLQAAFEQAGFVVQVEVEQFPTQIYLSPTLLQRWFPAADETGTSYAASLGQTLTRAQIKAVEAAFTRYLSNQTLSWSSTIAFLYCKKDMTNKQEI